jgi:hypothetical protein
MNGCRRRTALWAPAAITQTRSALRLIALEVFVTRFAAVPKIGAQLRKREATRPGQNYKAFFLGHYISFFPWHLAI